MGLDVKTLFLVTIYAEAMLGLLLLFIWIQNSKVYAVAWWGGGHLMRAGSVALFGMYGSVPGAVSIDVANAILLSSFAVTWSGARVFDGRALKPIYLFGGAVLWLFACRIPIFAESIDARFLLISSIITAYTWATAYEFWRGRGEALLSRWFAILILFAHGALFLLRTPVSMILPWSPTDEVFDSIWLTVLTLEALLFTVAIAFILPAMAKERSELQHKTDASVDALTGIANRRAFYEEAEAIAVDPEFATKSIVVLLADLDHFKSINDRLGHATGDRVLRIFSKEVRQRLGSGALFGRLGGEEFAILLRNAGNAKGLAAAERIRLCFEAAAATMDGRPLGATVSIGMVTSESGPHNINALLAQADEALYCAKERGRNRVETTSYQPPPDVPKYPDRKQTVRRKRKMARPDAA